MPPADAVQYDSESLWPRLEAIDWRGAAALIVRGERGRDWLAGRLRAAGAAVDDVVAYRRLAPSFDAGARAVLDAALAAPDHHVWLFSSSESIDNLVAAVPEDDDRQAAA